MQHYLDPTSKEFKSYQLYRGCADTSECVETGRCAREEERYIRTLAHFTNVPWEYSTVYFGYKLVFFPGKKRYRWIIYRWRTVQLYEHIGFRTSDKGLSIFSHFSYLYFWECSVRESKRVKNWHVFAGKGVQCYDKRFLAQVPLLLRVLKGLPSVTLRCCVLCSQTDRMNPNTCVFRMRLTEHSSGSNYRKLKAMTFRKTFRKTSSSKG